MTADPDRVQRRGRRQRAWLAVRAATCYLRAMTLGPDLAGFARDTFTCDGESRTVYRAGTGPGVVVVHEIPGITPAVHAFAARVVAAGFTVAMPSLFGEPGRPLSPGYVVSHIARACIAREFVVLASDRSSPITTWLRALCRDLHARAGGPGVGAIGMCLTGNFGIALMVEPSVRAPVLCQPSLPFAIDKTRRAALHASPAELEVARQRMAEGAGLLALRFTGDLSCPRARFERLREELPGVETIEIDNRLGNPHGISPFAHSVVTNDLVDVEGHPTRAALERVLGFFDEHLRPESRLGKAP